MQRWIKIVIFAVLAAAVAAGGYFYAQRSAGDEELRTVRAERGEVRQDVSFTGTVAAKQSVDLAFEVGGTVAEITVDVGDTVTAGQVLAKLDSRLASLELARARADVAAAQEQKYLAWQSAVRDAEATADENEQLLESKRQAVRNAKIELEQQRSVVSKTERDSGDAAATSTAVLNQRVKESALKSAQRDIDEALAAVEKSNDLKRAAADEARAAYEATQTASGRVAGMASLEAARALAAARLDKTVLRAPFDGTVTARTVEIVEYAAAGSTVLTLESTGDIELTADVPEADAVKFTVGAPATFTLDAHGARESWPATVAAIAPAAKILEGVPTYEVTFQPAVPEARFKLGLTTNIVVQAALRYDAVSVPRRAVLVRDSGEFVRVKEGEVIREVGVKTGLLGSDGRVEITVGLSGGEEVVLADGADRR